MADLLPAPVIAITNVCTRFGAAIVHENLSLEVRRGEIFGLAGSSGCGKSTLLREMIMLHRPQSGSIRIFGEEVIGLDDAAALRLRKSWGVMFERGALFSSLTVAENVAMPMREHAAMSDALIDELVAVKLSLAGLPASAAAKFPDELSGGMRKRAALARAMALDPDLLFLDEPTAGLDPLSANGFDELVLHLQQALGLTIMMVTHDLDLLWRVADRVAILGEGKVLGMGTMTELSESSQPLIREYFYGPRGRVAWDQAREQSREKTWKPK